MKLLLFACISFIFVFGCLMHFVYDISGKNKLVGIISPVNESVWEHLKLILYPAIILNIILYMIFPELRNNFFSSSLISIIAAMLTILIIFYSYISITGHPILFMDIFSFFAATVILELTYFKIIEAKKLPLSIEQISFGLLIILIFAFTAFTFFPPKLKLFKQFSEKA